MSFTQQVLDKLVELSADREKVSLDDLSLALPVMNRAEQKKLSNALYELVKAGKAKRLKIGVYTAAARQKPQTDDYRRVMWRYIRAKRLVSAADLVRVSGCTLIYAREYLRCLEDRGLVRRESDEKFRLIQDPGPETPANEAKKKYLCQRRRIVRAMVEVNKAMAAGLEAMKLLSEAAHDLPEAGEETE